MTLHSAARTDVIHHIQQLSSFSVLEHSSMAATAAPAPQQLRVAVLTGPGCDPECVEQTCKHLLHPGLHVDTVTPQQVQRGVLQSYDVFISPGGGARWQAQALGFHGCRRIVDFVRSGGGYIGICAGAFLAMYTRFPTLKLAPVSITSWKRAEGMPQIATTPELFEILGPVASPARQGSDASSQAQQASASGGTPESMAVFFEDGPLLREVEATGLPRPRVLARYSSTLFEDDHGLPTDLASSSHSIVPLGAKRPGGAPDHKPGPPGMYGAIAALATDFGRGRVLLCSCHPEFTPGWETAVQRAAAWVGEGAKQATAAGVRRGGGLTLSGWVLQAVDQGLAAARAHPLPVLAALGLGVTAVAAWGVARSRRG